MMPTLFTEADELRRWRSSLPTDSAVAFVPTMGALHAGHERLIQEAMSMAKTVIVSVFVNPLQFNDPKDLVQYPRTLDADIEICRRQGVDAIFAPTPDEVYPPDQVQVISAGTLGSLYEGQHRPGHFDGVLTVVDRLFTLVEPSVAIFGEKDYQQLTLILQMAATRHPSIRIARVPTVRDPDGLAISSRNIRLTPIDRASATKLYESLRYLHKQHLSGVTDAKDLERDAIEYLKQFDSIALDYLVCVDAGTLERRGSVDHLTVVLLAATIGGVRLIDNVLLKP
jgi:pantoate--beta-alanine ligase